MNFNGVVDAFHGLIQTLAHIEFTGAIYCTLMLCLAVFVCLEGIKIYKLVIGFGGFILGYVAVHDLLSMWLTSSELLLMLEVAGGLLLAVLAWKIYVLGVGFLAFQFAYVNINPTVENKIISFFISVAAAALIGFLAMKLNRPVIVVLTAVLGGFSAVNYFQQLMPVFPADLSFFPPPGSAAYYFAKVFLSAAGVGIQDVREPRDPQHES
ncbi:MAG: hypothetical protein IJT34_00245 [Butyrivibrio sp.]|nr:hypothetical protein [Butyrivibrio sp.]